MFSMFHFQKTSQANKVYNKKHNGYEKSRYRRVDRDGWPMQRSVPPNQ